MLPHDESHAHKRNCLHEIAGDFYHFGPRFWPQMNPNFRCLVWDEVACRTAYLWPGTTTSMVRPCVAFKSECSTEELLGNWQVMLNPWEVNVNPYGVENWGGPFFSRRNCTHLFFCSGGTPYIICITDWGLSISLATFLQLLHDWCIHSPSHVKNKPLPEVSKNVLMNPALPNSFTP